MVWRHIFLNFHEIIFLDRFIDLSQRVLDVILILCLDLFDGEIELRLDIRLDLYWRLDDDKFATLRGSLPDVQSRARGRLNRSAVKDR